MRPGSGVAVGDDELLFYMCKDKFSRA